MDKKNILIISVIALIVSFFIDSYLVEFFKLIQLGFLSNFFGLINIIGSFVGVLIIGTIYLLLKKRKKELYPFWITVFTVSVVCYFLKILIARERPAEYISSFVNLMRYAMPSAHTAVAFSAIPFFKKQAKKYWIYFAVLIAFSRLYTLNHFLSDVIVGGLIGWGIVKLVIYFYKKK